MTPARVLFLAAALCFLVALLIAVNAFGGSGNEMAWVDGGLIATALGLFNPFPNSRPA